MPRLPLIVKVSPPLQRVVVYKNSAQLNFSGSLSGTTFEPGSEYALHLEGSWNTSENKSFLAGVRGEGAELLILKSVRIKEVTTVEDTRPRVRELNALIEEADFEIRDAQDALDAIDYRISCVRRVLNKFSHLGAKALPPHAYDPAKWEAISSLALGQLSELNEKRRTHVSAITKLCKGREGLEFQRKILRGGEERVISKKVAEILLQVEDGAPCPVDGSGLSLEVSYLVQGASWNPVYDVRVNPSTQDVTLDYSAFINQSTVWGEWTNVEVQLSTANPQVGGDPPQLTPWVIGIYRPVPDADFLRSVMNENIDQILCRHEKLEELAERSCLLESNANEFHKSAKKLASRVPLSFSTAPARVETATVTKSSTAFSFSIPGRHTVASGGERVKVAIALLPLSGEYEYVAVPKLTKSTYLQVRCTNNSPFTLLPGPSSVFLNNQLIATASLDMVSPGENFLAHLGIDDTVEVERTEMCVRESESTSFLSGKSIATEFRYVFAVKNNHISCSGAGKAHPTCMAGGGDPSPSSNKMRLTIRDQFPISDDRDCTVSLMDPKLKRQSAIASSSSSSSASPGLGNQQPFQFTSSLAAGPVTNPMNTVETTDTNEVMWTLCDLHPGEERSFEFAFTVEHGAGVAVAGM